MRTILVAVVALYGCGGTDPQIRNPHFMSGQWDATWGTQPAHFVFDIGGAAAAVPLPVSGTFAIHDIAGGCNGSLAGTAESRGLTLVLTPSGPAATWCQPFRLLISTPPMVPDAPITGEAIEVGTGRLVEGRLLFTRSQ